MFEEFEPDRRLPIQRPRARRVWDGRVRGNLEYWVVVARDEEDLGEWLLPEQEGVEMTSLRVCRAILENGELVLEEDDHGYEDSYEDYLGTI